MSVSNPVEVAHLFLFEQVRTQIQTAVDATTPHDDIVAALQAENLPLDVGNLLEPTVPADPDP